MKPRDENDAARHDDHDAAKLGDNRHEQEAEDYAAREEKGKPDRMAHDRPQLRWQKSAPKGTHFLPPNRFSA